MEEPSSARSSLAYASVDHRRTAAQLLCDR